jgi:hypothetical protein
MTKTEARVIMSGLFPSGQDIRSLTLTGREEIRDAVDTILRLYDYDNARLTLALEQLDRADAEIRRLREQLAELMGP